MKKQTAFYHCIVMCALALVPAVAHAKKQAKMMLIPTRVVMQDGARAATIELRNNGDATGQYTISLIDMEMKETGQVVALPSDQPGEFSAIPYLHLSPKSTTLTPGESQVVRVMQKRNQEMEPGEYRAHLRVKIENDNVEGLNGSDPVPPAQTSISVKANVVVIMPVILRVGETEATLALENPQVIYDAQGKPILSLNLLREGNRSAIGDFSITYKSPGGDERLMTFFPGVAIYRPTPKREVTIPLDVPSGVSLKQGSLDITYSAQEQEGGKPLAKTSLNLP